MDFLKIYIIDIVLVLLFISWVVYYYRKGFVRSVLEFCSFFAAAVVTRAYYVPLADWIRAKTSLCSGTAGEYKAKFIAMIILFIAVSLVLKILIGIVDKFFKLPILKTANKALGLVIGTLCGVLMVTGACVLINALTFTGYEPLKAAARSSKIMELDSKLIAAVFPAVKEFIQGGI